MADHEDALSSWLASHGVEQDWVIAPALAAAGVDVAWCERAADVLGEATLEPGLEWVASTLSTTTLLAEVKESTRRVSELVAAVRSYSQMDRASSAAHRPHRGAREHPGDARPQAPAGSPSCATTAPTSPLIDAYAGELNQVWTNLIDNAVDAMEGDGTLRVSTRAEGDAVVVEIGDTGPGMPEVAARAFEAFYTTKDVGKGTGLGLDIARRIVVERHGGTIDIDSTPAGTVLRVRLPISG